MQIIAIDTVQEQAIATSWNNSMTEEEVSGDD